MIENREAWMTLLFSKEIEGEWSDRDLADDPGGWTMRGISRPCYAEYIGREPTKAEMQAITAEIARDVAITMFWNPVNADKLPGGIDIFAADFAFHSHWTQASRELQELVGVKPDGFIGDQTLTAVRKQKPLELLMRYHDARMVFLEGLKNWDANAKGWSKRCRLMLALARTKVQARPILAEAINSRTVQGAVVGAAASTVALEQQGFSVGGILEWIMGLIQQLAGGNAGLPEMLQSVEPTASAAIEHANQIAAQPGLAGHISAAVTLATSLYVVWRRVHDFRKGKR